MTIVPISDAEPVELTPTPPNQLDRFTVTASGTSPEPASQGVRTHEVETAWTPFLGPTAMMFARKADHYLSNLKDGQQSVAVIVSRWAEALGCYPEEVIAAKNRLIRFGLALWEEKGHVLSLHRNWPPVPAAIQTPEHRALLLSIPDIHFDLDEKEGASDEADPR